MKDELNTYGITNADGVAPSAENEGKVAFDNDKPGFIRESVTSEQDEMAHVSESYGDQAGASEEGGSDEEYSEQDLSATSSTASASSSAASASASIGSGLGALAGVVATSVVAAVVVVAVFISTLAISLSLLMADMHSLVFGVTITGAAEEDFAQPIYAVLTSDDGSYFEQEVKQDTALLTFEGLEPGREYRLTVKNETKVFAEVTAFTPTEPNEKGTLLSSMQGTDVRVSVQSVKLKSTEYYSLTAKDAQGNVLFAKDGMDAPAEYRFELTEPKDVYFYLTVGGSTYALSQCLLPDYDLTNGVWSWSDDLLTANATFTDKRGGEPLVLTATVTRKKVEPTCEEEGAYVHTAKVEYAGKTYTAKASLPIAAYEHNYVLDPTGGTYTCTRCGDSYTNEE
ncbi:MAG: hypothetical protein IJU10_00490 [Clostridia bacterium]|nr:hypothetical protein [Clostridia bacterium]